jgi:hypothetical protein
MLNSHTLESITPFVEPTWYSREKSVYYNESHNRLRDAVQAYVEEKITPYCAEWEAQGFVPVKVSIADSHVYWML